MIVHVPLSVEQEQLVADHLLRGKELYVAPGERICLVNWVVKNHPGHIIESAEIDLGQGRWNLSIRRVTVTS